MVAVATISHTEHLGEHRGYRLHRDWCRGSGGLGRRWSLCVGYRASSAPRTVRGAVDDYDPHDVRDGEAPHFDSEADARAAIDATFEAPGEAA